MRLLRRLSLAGGGTLQAIEQVCAGSAVAGLLVAGAARAVQDVLLVLAALVDKSLLIVRTARATGCSRSSWAYGRERLAEAGETEEVRRRHAAYFLGRPSERARPAGAAQLELALRKLAAEQDNLHAAVRGAVAARERGNRRRALSGRAGTRPGGCGA